MNINQVQNDFVDGASQSSERRSLDQIMKELSSGSSGDDVRILPIRNEVGILPIKDNVGIQPMPERETQLYDLEKAILNGDPKSWEEIMELVKTIGRDGKTYFNTNQERVMALGTLYITLAEENPAHPVLSALSQASNRLLYIDTYSRELLEQITNPTLLNGGKNPSEVEE